MLIKVSLEYNFPTIITTKSNDYLGIQIQYKQQFSITNYTPRKVEEKYGFHNAHVKPSESKTFKTTGFFKQRWEAK